MRTLESDNLPATEAPPRPGSERLTALRAGRRPVPAEPDRRPPSTGADRPPSPPGPAGFPPTAAALPRRPETPPGRPPDGSPEALPDTAPLPVPAAARTRLVARLAERWVPAAWRGARLDPGRPGALALAVVAGCAALLAVFAVWRDRPVAEPAPPLPVVGAEVPSVPAGPGGPPPSVEPVAPTVVSVAGKVRRPGLVRLPGGARVADAISQVGGPLPGADLTALNLARRVVDGEHIVVGLPQPPSVPQPAGSPGPAAAGGGKVDLNQATAEQLDTLPGVGPVTAKRIIEWRTAHGRFNSVDQLREIEGIGERRFSQLRGSVTV